MTKAKTQSSAKRSFAWGIKSTDIGFMRLGPADGTPVCCDCGCSAVTPIGQKKRRLPKTGAR